MTWQRAVAACVLVVFSASIASAQANTDAGREASPAVSDGSSGISSAGGATVTADTVLTPLQEKALLDAEDHILHFVSKDTQLPIKSAVKCRFISRAAVNSELRKKFDQDKGAKRMERSELVLKKFGLLDESFQMRPFLLSLLTEQIAGFYDDKTKQMNLLDWVPIAEQKPVMAHELTHALQDQKVGLDKWGSQEIEGVAKNVKQDNRHIANDDTDTAREAVLEGQAMVSFADYMLAQAGHPDKTLRDAPQLAQELEANAGDMSDSPVLARAPLVLQQSLLFPYTSGLAFEQAILMKSGTDRAFTGVLDAPPSASFQIMTPEAYLRDQPVPLMKLPDLHPLLKRAGYVPYDVGVMGELDVRMTTELFGGEPLAKALTSEWDGGVYYAAQRKDATAAEKETTASLALLYSSEWKNKDSARSFFEVFEQELPRQYDGLARRQSDEKDDDERVYSTKEGDVLLALKDNTVWVSEGFDLQLARKLRESVDEANAPIGSGPVMQARVVSSNHDLVGGLVDTLSQFGIMKTALR
ncbi:MAG: hypothetical protein WB439_00940 [Acidobacteriaceae bacterium]